MYSFDFPITRSKDETKWIKFSKHEKFKKILSWCFLLNLTNGAYPSQEINDRREVLNDGLVEFEISTNGSLRIMNWSS